MRFLGKKLRKNTVPGAYKPWGRINTHCNHLKRFKQKFRPKYALKCFIFGKSWKTTTALGVPPPNPFEWKFCPQIPEL